MVARIGNFFESLITNLLSGSDSDHHQLPWCDGKIVATAKAEKTEADIWSDECTMRLWWCLVHSMDPKDVKRGIVMIEASLRKIDSSKLMEKFYLLVVANYRSGNYSRARQVAKACLEEEPESRKFQDLIKAIDDEQRKKDLIDIGIVVVGLIVGGIAVVVFARKK